MQLSDAEFRAMNHGFRRFVQRRIEYPILSNLGLSTCTNKDVIEIGCGGGFGVALIQQLKPRSCVGIDLMPEQIALAEARAIPNARFEIGDASALGLPDESADLIVVFGILHHVERWHHAILECQRLLRQEGLLLVEEPDAALLRGWDRVR